MVRFAFFALVLLSLLSACGSGGDGSTKPTAKIYHHSEDNAPTSLDPAQAAVVYSNIIVVNVYDTLYRYKYLKRPYELQPNLAAGMPEISDDGLTYTIHIKPGVRFIDDPAFPGGKGREVTAQDIVYSLQRHFDPATRSQGAWLWRDKIQGMREWKAAGSDYAQPMAGLAVPDRYTLIVRLLEPYPQFPFTLAQGFSAVVPREAVRYYGRELAIHPVGSGPFILDSFTTAKAVLRKNPHFRAEPVDLAAEGFDPKLHKGFGLEAIANRAPPFLDELDIDFIQETAARWNSFTKRNEIEYTTLPKEQLANVVERFKPSVVLRPEYEQRYFHLATPESGFVFFAFNMADPRIGRSTDPKRDAANKALRCAIRKAWNWDQRNQVFYFGQGRVFPGVIPPAVPEFDPDMSTDSIRFDPVGARKMLADAGWTKETLPVFEYGFTSAVIFRQMFEQLRGFLLEIGYPDQKIVGDRFATFGDVDRAIRRGKLMSFLSAWKLDYPDAQSALQLFYGPNHAPGSNASNYQNPRFDALYERAALLHAGAERTALYRRMNQIVTDDCVVISGLARTRINLWHKNVIEYPDREMLGGFFLRYVDVKPASGNPR